MEMTKTPWNKGKSVGQKKPFTPRQVEMLKEFLANAGKTKELALFSFGIDSMLRSSDLLKIKVEDILDFKGQVKTQISLKQQKTKQSHAVRISKTTAEAVDKWIKLSKKYEDDWLFTAELHGKQNRTPMSHHTYKNFVKSWCKILHLDPRDYSTHSIRRTRAAMVFRATSNIELVRQLLGQKSVTSTSAYLNLSQQQALDSYEAEFLK
jgi:integrase